VKGKSLMLIEVGEAAYFSSVMPYSTYTYSYGHHP
jgi:hypothetical protein